MSSIDELVDLLARLVGTLTVEDLTDDPELSGLLGQLLQILNPKAKPLPAHMLEALAAIDNRMERFKAAADMVGAYDPEKLKTLSDSLRDAGLLKNEVPVGVMPESALEDLMKEHSILRRLMAIYKKAMEGHLNIEIIKETAKLVKLFVHEYHEVLEEKYIFPLMTPTMPELVKDLNEQHQIVRKLTDTIIDSTNPADVHEAAKEFIRIYAPHGAKEDTELFPAWRNSMSAEAYAGMGSLFSEMEEMVFGEGGEEKILEIVSDIESKLGISELQMK